MKITKMRIAATALLVPHVIQTGLAAVLLFYELGVIDFRGDRKVAITYSSIGLVGGALTCAALWRPGKFSSLGIMSRVRIAALVWNLINACWLSFLLLKYDLVPRQIFEMALAYITLCALMIFAIEEKK